MITHAFNNGSFIITDMQRDTFMYLHVSIRYLVQLLCGVLILLFCTVYLVFRMIFMKCFIVLLRRLSNCYAPSELVIVQKTNLNWKIPDFYVTPPCFRFLLSYSLDNIVDCYGRHISLIIKEILRFTFNKIVWMSM